MISSKLTPEDIETALRTLGEVWGEYAYPDGNDVLSERQKAIAERIWHLLASEGSEIAKGDRVAYTVSYGSLGGRNYRTEHGRITRVKACSGARQEDRVTIAVENPRPGAARYVERYASDITPDPQATTQHEPELARLTALAIELGASELNLDENVHDLASSQATEVNNSGVAGQVRYLLTAAGASEAERMIRAAAGDGQ